MPLKASSGKVCLFPPIFRCSQHVSFIQHLKKVSNLEEKSKDLASQMFSSGLFVVHDSTRGCHDDVTEKKGKFLGRSF